MVIIHSRSETYSAARFSLARSSSDSLCDFQYINDIAIYK